MRRRGEPSRGEPRRHGGRVVALPAGLLPALLALLLGAGLAPVRARAHPLSPSLLQVDERGDGTVAVTWKTPSMRVRGTRLEPELPASCKALGPRAATEQPGSVTFRWRVACGRGGLAGERVGVRGLETSLTDALVRVRLADGREFQAVLRPERAFVALPASRSGRPLALRIASGVRALIDRPTALLLVAALTLLGAARGRRARTVAAFALGQALALAMATLRLVTAPEAGLALGAALGLYALSVELARRSASWLGRRVELAALALGLVAGLVLAPALERGVTAGPLAASLLAFQGGLLVGLAATAAAVAGLASALVWLGACPAGRLGRTAAYPLGGLASYWLIQGIQRSLG